VQTPERKHALPPAWVKRYPGSYFANVALLCFVLACCGAVGAAGERIPSGMNAVVPKPVSVKPARGAFTVTPKTRVFIASPELGGVGRYLAGLLRHATGYPIPVSAAAPTDGDIALLVRDLVVVGDEGYELSVRPDRVVITGVEPAGVFYGVQTLRQLVPAKAPWLVPAAQIVDSPRFPWRGAMLDVARHFFGVADVEHFIDAIAAYKLNRLHLHLSDDQGWRIAIRSRPNLARHGGATAVGGGQGGYYTQRQYRELVAYAQSRFVTIVPEIDMPGHVNAALSSYPELTCDGKAPPLFTGIDVGFSSLCTTKASTYRFLDQVIGEIAALTPGPWFHIGGDEAAATKPADYVRFIERAQRIVRKHGKQMIGWEEVARATLAPHSVVQHWNIEPAKSALAGQAVKQGAKVIMSPAAKAYLDMKYNASTRLGLRWAGYTSVRDAYEWDPGTLLAGVGEGDLLGVEAPLWTETVTTRADIDYLAFPRLIGIAEIAWSPRAGRSWRDYRLRLAAQGPRLRASGVRFYRSPEIPWASR
jgi:hexosaminidase